MGKTEKRNKQPKAKQVVGLGCLFVFLCIACVFSFLILYDITEGFVADNRAWLLVAATVVFLLLLILGCVFCFRRMETLFRLTISAAFLFALFAVVYYLLQKVGFLSIIHDPVRYEEFLKSAGGWIAAVYMLLQYLQVVVLPIPSIVSTLAGVALFGVHLATLYSFVGILAGSFTAFLSVGGWALKPFLGWLAKRS